MKSMSRQANLPPRYPFQKKSSVHPVYALNPQHYKSSSQRFVKEEQPPSWINDLLDDSESVSNTILQRRSANHSLTLSSADPTNRRDSSASCGGDDGRLKPVSLYGPNSPRGKGKHTIMENDIVSTLSEYVCYKQTQNSDESLSASKVASFELAEERIGSTAEVIPEAETKLVKRHPGQRSRIRKLQYIAELETTVGILQQMESDLAAKVAGLVRQRVSLSVENSKLKQKMVRLQQQEVIVDGQNQKLLKEFELLKVNMSKGNNSNSGFKATSVLENAEINWQMLDMGKLNLH